MVELPRLAKYARFEETPRLQMRLSVRGILMEGPGGMEAMGFGRRWRNGVGF